MNRRRTPAAAAAGLMLVALIAVRAQARGQQPAADTDVMAALSDAGEAIYMRDCSSCHGAEGTSDGAGPALSGNAKLVNKTHVVTQIVGGSLAKGMEAFGKTLSDHDIAAVATFVRNAWGNDDGVVLESDVAPIRATLGIPAPK